VLGTALWATGGKSAACTGAGFTAGAAATLVGDFCCGDPAPLALTTPGPVKTAGLDVAAIVLPRSVKYRRRGPGASCAYIRLSFAFSDLRAYRWFCRLGLEETVPDHSSFSKNRRGRLRESDVFRHVFEGVVHRCMSEGLVRGEGFAIDASVVNLAVERRKHPKSHATVPTIRLKPPDEHRVFQRNRPNPDIRLFELRAKKLPLVSMGRNAFAVRIEVSIYGAPMWGPVRHAFARNRKNRAVARAAKPSVDAVVRIAARIPAHQENTRLPCKNCDAANPKYSNQISRYAP
jgi:hypothetical protein